MSPAARSVFAFGLYLATGGIFLVLAPDWTCNVAGLRPPGETLWVRLGGMLFLDVAYYCIRAARSEEIRFIRWSVLPRLVTLPFLGVVVAAGLENPSILVFGVVDTLAALWTILALPRSGVTPARASTRSGYGPGQSPRPGRSASAWPCCLPATGRPQEAS